MSEGTQGHQNEMSMTRLEARIERLERENRRWKRGALGCLIALVCIGLAGSMAGGLMGQQTKAKAPAKAKAKTTTPIPPAEPAPVALPANIEAQSFVLKDASGKTRAELSMGGIGPALKLMDPSGSTRLTVGLNDSAPGGPMLLFADSQHQAGVSMSVLDGSGAQLTLMGQRPDIQAHIGVTTDGTSIDLTDQDGFTTSIGSGVQPTKNGQTKKSTAASITLMGKDRKLLWSEP